MHSVFLLRRDPIDLRRTQAVLESSREHSVAGVASRLFAARSALRVCDPDLVLADIRLEDGALMTLIRDLRSTVPPTDRPRVLVVTPHAEDPMLYAAMVSGADSFIVESEMNTAPAAIARTMAGQAVMSASVARQVLGFFGLPVAPAAGKTVNERALDWNTHATNPMRLSPGEQHLLVAMAEGSRTAEMAVRCAISVENIGRRVANIYRKLQWDVRMGSLTLSAA